MSTGSSACISWVCNWENSARPRSCESAFRNKDALIKLGCYLVLPLNEVSDLMMMVMMMMMMMMMILQLAQLKVAGLRYYLGYCK